MPSWLYFPELSLFFELRSFLFGLVMVAGEIGDQPNHLHLPKSQSHQSSEREDTVIAKGEEGEKKLAERAQARAEQQTKSEERTKERRAIVVKFHR